MLEFRPALLTDTPEILRLIRQLAAFEKMTGDVIATQDSMEACLFAPKARVFCEIAVLDGKMAGLAIWYYSFSTFLGQHGIYLEDLIVGQEMRNRGIGTKLLRQLAKRCVAENLARLEWSVLDWNIPSVEFYKSRGAVLLGEWTKGRLSEGQLSRFAGEA